MAVTEDFQYEFQNLLLGPGTPYIVERAEGLLGPTRTTAGDQEKPTHHGAFAGRHILQRRVVTMGVKTASNPRSDVETRIDELVGAFTPSSSLTEYPLYFKRPGKDVRFILARTTRGPAPVSDFKLARGLGEFLMELVATDPRVYSATSATANMSISPGSSTNSVAAGNSTQTWDELDQFMGSPPVITINGPALNPRIANQQCGNRSIKLTVNLLAGQTIVIDVRKRQVLLNGVLNYGIVADDNQWWEMVKGTNDLTFSRTGTSGTATCQVVWYPAHMR